MKNNYVFVPGLFALGIVVGIVITNSRDDEPVSAGATDETSPVFAETTKETVEAPNGNDEEEKSTWFFSDDSSTEQIKALEDKVATLETRIAELEKLAKTVTDDQPGSPHSRADIRLQQLSVEASIQSLAKAGISRDIASDIIRRKNDLELKKLELRDRASREGYLGSTRYINELTDLEDEETSLRDELGDDTYDRYLYANGQTNRVKILTVLQGSAAEQAGVIAGDLVLTYDQQRMFEWSELKNATSEGVRGEYVSMDILRGKEQLSLWVPRGPLGVRLGAARVAP